ncbi:MAG: hypothetical protein ABSC50_09925 [Candidatus Bathyarchaeia archaeon]
MPDIMVLHDFDNPYLSGNYAFRRGLKLIVYALSKKIPLLRRWVKDIYSETYSNCKTLAALDKLLGLDSKFGLKAEVLEAFPGLDKELAEMGFHIHKHAHISRDDVRWEPPLNVEKEAWFFDQNFHRSREIPGHVRWAVFHADYPYLLPTYIDFLLQARAIGRV